MLFSIVLMFQFMFMVQLLVKFRFFIQSYGKESLYKYCMNVDDGRIMCSSRSCLLVMERFNFTEHVLA
jgi:hypothetical protein